VTKAVTEAAGQLLDELGQLPADQIHEYPDSNAWAVNGPKVDGGGALLGGDPHLPQTLPSIWYEVALSAPGYQVAGASLPGVPGVLLGHNAHIAWSLTDTQDSATLYYAEQVRGDEYYWRGAWRKMTMEHYTIPVRGGATVHLAVDITVHGPIMTQVGQRMAVDWMGNVPSDDLGALLGINQASNWTQFKAALADWRAPTQNFTYADNDPVTGKAAPQGQTGNIGVYAAGYYPQVPSGCQPWLPMSGSGQCDIDGVIVAGAAAGMASLRRPGVVPAATLGAVAGWALPLWVLALRGLPAGATARAIAALAGIPPYAAVAVAVTLLLAALQTLAGAWLARAFFPRRRSATSEDLGR
jgi:penicillin amidase